MIGSPLMLTPGEADVRGEVTGNDRVGRLALPILNAAFPAQAARLGADPGRR